MGVVDTPQTHREEVGLLIDEAGSRFALGATVLFIGAPILGYLSGIEWAPFYIHVALGAFWFGFDFFFKFILGPSLDAAPDDAAGAVNAELVPKMVVVAEPLSVAVVGSGILLADLFGYWTDPTIWLWGALGLGIAMLLVGFGPLHVITTKMAVEFNKSTPDPDRLDALFTRALQWGLLQTVFMIAIIAMMVGLRGLFT